MVGFSAYGVINVVAYALAFLMRFEFDWPMGYTALFVASLMVLVAVRTACAAVYRLSTGRWRFVSTDDIVRLFGAATTGTGIFFIITRLIPDLTAVPRSVIAFEWVLTIFFTSALWLSYRLAFERLRLHRARNGETPRRVLVLGSGEAGSMLVHEMRRFPTGYKPIGFVDDDPLKRGTSLHGVEVIGSINDVPAIVEAERADELIIAIPSARPEELRRIVKVCEDTGLCFKLLPGIAEVLAGEAHLYHLRDVRIEDLLGRDPIRLELPELAEDLLGKSVLITGAAGSIGSELSRQIALHEPARLVLVDQAETPLVELGLELEQSYPELRLVTVVGDVTHEPTVERIFNRYSPDEVFHAAAYKHVPIMEFNATEAIRNNVLGTWRVADAAGRNGTRKFVLVSTDKAVRPASVMGATKRMAEMLVLEEQQRFPGTSYGAVRFGNVLGSSGSVIPLFRRQMEEGRPLTVTHPEVTRYFMTIPEAVQLILQASLLPDLRGHLAMLEMGDPVNITQLAKNLLRLSGSTRQEGKDIVFTGLRPGEKLHEELVGPGEQTVETTVAKVRLVVGHMVHHGSVLELAQRWSASIDGGEPFDAEEGLADLFSSVRPGRVPMEGRSVESLSGLSGG